MYVYVSQKHLASDDLLALSDVKQAFPTKSLVRLPFIQYTHFYTYRSVRVVWQLTIINNFDVLEFLLLGRLRKVDLIILEGKNVCPSVRPSVRPSVHKKFLQFE